ncbi:MAG: tol-pal system-associated acyl-CoA thioesterase [Gammaproteobacteria bacterium]|nr:tol-pal system-associated acyl-CoA thioesterase [Gammaproteobacteria bacterium]
MSQPDTFSIPVRVYYEDTDAGGVVFYANYLKFMERARTEWLRSMGVEQQQLIETEDALFAIVNVNINYRKPARLDDLLNVTVRIDDIGHSSIMFHQQVIRESDNTVLVEGSVKAACLSASKFRPRAIPSFIKERFPA